MLTVVGGVKRTVSESHFHSSASQLIEVDRATSLSIGCITPGNSICWMKLSANYRRWGGVEVKENQGIQLIAAGVTLCFSHPPRAGRNE